MLMLIKFEKRNLSGVETEKSKFYRVGKEEGPFGQRALWTSDLESYKVRAGFKEEVRNTKEVRSTFNTSDTSMCVYYMSSSLLGSVRDIK